MANTIKQDIIKTLSQKSGVTIKESSEIVGQILDTIKEGLEKNGTVKLSNFGTFILKSKKERIGRNPKTGVAAVISARKTVLFHPSQNFKDHLNK